MPRLAGKQSNEGLLVSLLMLAAIATAIGLEYAGVIDIVPDFGREKSTLSFNSLDISSAHTVVSNFAQK